MKLFLLLLLFSLTQATTILQLEKLLAKANSAQRCRVRLAEKIEKVEAELAKAIKCRFNGLPIDEYKRKREVCRKRGETEKKLKKCKETSADCSAIQHQLARILAACEAIGWVPSRPNCKRIHPLRKKLASLKKKKCPYAGDIDEVTTRLHAAADRKREELGLSPPAYNTTIFEPSDGPAKTAMILLHGVLGSAEQVFPAAETLQLLMPRTRIVVPQAKVAFVTIFNQTGPSWFDLLNNDVGLTTNPANVTEVAEAAMNIDALGEMQRKVYGIAEKRVLIAGISQGGGLALAVELRYVVGAATALAGFIPDVTAYPAALNPNSTGTHTLLVHGVDDTVVPIEAARLSRMALTQFGSNVTYCELQGIGHNLSPKYGFILPKVANFFEQALGGF